MAMLLSILILLCVADTVLPTCSSRDVDLGILVDGSSSFGYTEYVLTKRVLVSLLQSLDVSIKTTHVGIENYGNSPHLHAELGDNLLYDPIKLMLSILEMQFLGGEARTDLALKMANEELFAEVKGDRPSVRNVLVVITRGSPGPRNSTYKDALKKLKDRGIPIIAVGLGKDNNDKDLLELALGKRKRVFRVTEIEKTNLNKLKKVIMNSC